MEAKHPFSDQDWQATPEPVQQYIRQLEQTIAVLVNKVKELEYEAHLNLKHLR
jgi:hypothetical protein